MAESPSFPGRVGLQQRVLPSYRVAFLDRLAEACGGGLEVFAGRPRPQEAVLTGRPLKRAGHVSAENREWFGGAFYLCRQPGLGDWVRQLEPAVLILEANFRYLDNWRAARQAGQRGISVLGWGLGAPAVEASPVGLGRVIWSRFLSGFDGLIAYSSRGAQQYLDAGAPPGRVWVAVNAVVDGPEAVGERQPLAGRPLRVLFVGRLQARKRVDVLIEAVGGFTAEATLRIVGDGPARAGLGRLAERRGITAEFAGPQEGEALSASFQWADIFVLPGSGGLAVQQAMAHGLPVVVAEGDGTQADLVRPENGWLVPTGSPSALEAALRQAAADGEALRRRGEASRRLVEEEINLAAMVATFVQAMRAVTGSG